MLPAVSINRTVIANVSKMKQCVLVLTMVAAAVHGVQITDKEYYSMPKLYELDNYEECMSHHRAVFCVGSFELLQHRNDRLFDFIQKYSSSSHHFNHSKINRGYCLHTTCGHIEGSSLNQRFERCVNNLTRSSYGLETNLTELQYCTNRKLKRTVDWWDLGFAYVIGAILVLNVMGTAYDVLRGQDKKHIQPLLAWSLIGSWRRLTADYSAGDRRLSALRPIHGMKILTLLLIILAHSVYAFHITYLHNPRFLELTGQDFLSAFFQNGTMIVQTFILVSCFLLAYNLLISTADNPKRSFGITMLPLCMIRRITRISPLYLFILGLVTTWWGLASSGPLWAPLIDAEVSGCRQEWWTQALYVSNLINVDEKCLIHTWFLSVDMQMCLICVCLIILLGRQTRAAVYILSALLLVCIAINFFVSYKWRLVPMVKLMVPQTMRNHFAGEPSFQWLYKAPWNSLPTAIIGVITAFIHYNQQTDGCKPADNKCIRILYRLSVPCMFLWVVCGYFMKPVSDPVWLSLYAAIERPVFAAMTAFAMFGFFNKVDSIWWQLLSWRGWEILSRMSLSIYLVHWLLALLLMAVRTNTSSVTIFDIGEHWLATTFLSVWSALILHLFVEVPAIRFLQSFIHIS